MEKPEPAAILKLLFCLPAAALLACGCASYRPLPLAAAETVKEPDPAAVRVAAQEVRHPLLPPLSFDERDGLSPDEAAVLAVLANPELQAARARRGVAAAQLLQAGILPNPQLTAGLDFPTGHTRDTVTGYAAGVNWDLRELLSRGARREAAGAKAAAVDLDIAWQEWQAAEGAKLQVWRLFHLERKLALTRSVRADAEETLHTMQRGLELGERTAQEEAAAAAALAQDRLAVLEAEQAREKERLTLNRMLGLPPARIVPLQQDITPPDGSAAPTPAEGTTGFDERRLDLVALRLGYASQEDRLRAAVRAQFPRINIGLSRARDTDAVPAVGFAVAIDLPFFDRNQGAIAEEAATRQQLFAEYRARLFAARAEVASLQAEIAATRRQIDLAETALPAQEKAVRLYRRALALGETDVAIYLGLRRDLANARLVLIDLREKLTELAIALEIATGLYQPAPASPRTDGTAPEQEMSQ